MKLKQGLLKAKEGIEKEANRTTTLPASANSNVTDLVVRIQTLN